MSSYSKPSQVQSNFIYIAQVSHQALICISYCQSGPLSWDPRSVYIICKSQVDPSRPGRNQTALQLQANCKVNLWPQGGAKRTHAQKVKGQGSEPFLDSAQAQSQLSNNRWGLFWLLVVHFRVFSCRGTSFWAKFSPGIQCSQRMYFIDFGDSH